jgi:hypothetical protein
MNNPWKKYLLVTLGVGLPAAALSLPLWPPQPGVAPTPLQVILFSGIFAAEGLLFGFGVAFVLFGGPMLRSATRAAGVRSWPVFVSLAWTLLSWWPHDGFHRASPLGDLNATLRIDYAFHLTLVIAAVIVARFFLATIRLAARANARPVSSPAGPAARERAAA